MLQKSTTYGKACNILSASSHFVVSFNAGDEPFGSLEVLCKGLTFVIKHAWGITERSPTMALGYGG